MKKIDILGWYNRQNVGDDAFKAVFEKWFALSDVQFITPPSRTREDADLIILGGGAVVSPYYLDAITNKDTPRIAVGVNLEWESEAKLLARSGFEHVFLRAKPDVQLFHDALLDPSQRGEGAGDYIPDLAFYLKPTGEDVLSAYKRKDRRTLAVFATDYVMPGRDRDLYHFGPRADQFAQGLARVLDDVSDKCEIMLMPCSTGVMGNDKRVNQHIAAFMQHTPTIIERQFAPVEMIDFIAGCTATVCMRFHAHVFSIIAGTPFTSIQFTKKVRDLLDEYAPHVHRDLVSVYRREDGFFDFDLTRERIVESIVAGTHQTERPESLAFAKTHRNHLLNVRELVLSKWGNAV